MTTTEIPADNGANVEALLGVRDALAGTPQIAKFQWRSTLSWVNGTHSRYEQEGTTVLVIHHPARGGVMPRGTSRFESDFDFVFVTSTDENEDCTKTHELRSVKVKDFSEPPPVAYRLRQVFLGWSSTVKKNGERDKITSWVLDTEDMPEDDTRVNGKKLTDSQSKVLRYVKEHPEGVKQSQIESGTKVSHSAVSRACTELVELKMLTVEGCGTRSTRPPKYCHGT